MTAPADTEDLAAEAGEDPAAEARGGLTRGVLWTGLALGAALVTYMYSAGIAPRIPGIGEILGLIGGFAVVAVMIMAATTAVSHLLRWHHRDIAAWGFRHGKRTARWGYGHGRRHGGRLLGWLSAWAAARWQARLGGSPDEDEEPGPDRGRRDDPEGVPGQGAPEPCAACGNPGGGTWGPLVTYSGRLASGLRRIHRAHFEDPDSGFYGEPYEGGPASPDGGGPAGPAASINRTAVQSSQGTEGNAMTETTAGPAAGATTRTSGRRVPPVMRAVISYIDDFEPENDADLHEFLLGLAAGLHDTGASLNDLYELCTSPQVRIGRGGMSATHAAADAIAEASSGVAGASKALASYYEGVSEEVASGLELPKDGDFITGDAAG